ncbi:alpha/beta fold hydrolase [Xenorhabdus bharatensis]|uniref:alpha/beta fold hydrolase n=1 Tax=Xenorhabdus bharatensis TaxID=3136256 RepID=UPI0030F3F1BC
MTNTICFQHAPGTFHNIRGKRLWIEEAGSGEPLILLSGLGPAGSHVIFHPHFDILHTEFRVIYLDLFGRGKSDQPESLSEITFEEDILDVACVINKLCPDGAHVFGFSYGGLISLKLALDYPELIKSLLLCNSLHSPYMWQKNHENINKIIENQLPDVWSEISQLRRNGYASTSPEMQSLFARGATLVRFFDPKNSEKIATEPGARNIELYPIFCGEDVDFNIGGQILMIPDFRPRLKEISMPTRVIAGRFDRALYPLLQLDFSHENISLQFLEHSGSFSFIEENEEVMNIIRTHCLS